MLRLKWTVLLLLVTNVIAFAQSGLKISGKLRVLEPTEIRVETITGEVVLSAKIDRNQTFVMGPVEIVPDVYILSMGGTKQPIYLTNGEVVIKGFYDSREVANSSIDFTGVDEYFKLLNWLPEEKAGNKKTISPDVKGNLDGTMYSALAYLADIQVYEPNKFLWDCMPEDARASYSGKWLERRLDSLARFAIGSLAYDFEYVDPDGKMVRLSDFKGKYVLIDFWASWCGPCRQEMKNLLPIYEELKGDDLEFISISLDKREKDWRGMLKAENLPWIMLWNKEGFTVGDEPNTIQKAYGFYSIPFIVLVDKEGRIVKRGLRGEQVREAIVSARQK
jgi:thiol-disulfide oxidoreductase resA